MALQRLNPGRDFDDNIVFSGWSKMATPLTSFRITQVRGRGWILLPVMRSSLWAAFARRQGSFVSAPSFLLVLLLAPPSASLSCVQRQGMLVIAGSAQGTSVQVRCTLLLVHAVQMRSKDATDLHALEHSLSC